MTPLKSRMMCCFLLVTLLTCTSWTPVSANVISATGVDHRDAPTFSQLILPNGVQLSDEELKRYSGEWAHIAIVGLGMYTFNNWDEPKDSTWYVKAATATVTGGLTGATGGALSSAVTSNITKTAVGVYSATQQTFVQWSLNQD